MIHRRHVRLAGAAGGLVVAGCGGGLVAPDAPARAVPITEQALTPGQTALRVATIATPVDPDVVTVPALARAGESVTIGVTTSGGGCIREDTTVAVVSGLRADVVPYQRVYLPRAGEACTLELRVTRRPVRLTFAAPGSAQVVVTGRAGGDSLVRVVRAVEVR